MSRKPLGIGFLVAGVVIGGLLFWKYYSRPYYLAQNIHKPHIILILVDTLRADHLGCYGYERDTSPGLDAIAREGILFKNVFTVSPWTNTTIAALFTGQFPQAIFPPAERLKAITQMLPKEVNTAAEILKANGYRTVALVDHPSISPQMQYDQGFDTFIQLFKKGQFRTWLDADSNFVLKEFKEQLDASAQKRLFLYLHVVYPHRPYIPPAPYDNMFGPGFQQLAREEKKGIINMYDGEIRYTDEMITRIVDLLRKQNLAKETYVLITSDHGEGFWEHGHFDHGNTFFNELLRVPLIIKVPEQQRTSPIEITESVSNIDLFPTILELASIKLPQSVSGKSLLRYLKGKNEQGEANWIFSESLHSKDIHGSASVYKNLKYIYEPSIQKRPYHLYDLIQDPKERRNLVKQSGRYPEMHDRLLAHLQENQKRRAKLETKTAEPDEETQEQLRALGYIGDD